MKKEDSSSVDKFWDSFLAALNNGNVIQIKYMTTEQGWSSILLGKWKQTYKSYFEETGAWWKKDKITWNDRNAEDASLSLGTEDPEKGIYSTGIRFVKVEGIWKFDKLLGAK